MAGTILAFHSSTCPTRVLELVWRLFACSNLSFASCSHCSACSGLESNQGLDGELQLVDFVRLLLHLISILFLPFTLAALQLAVDDLKLAGQLLVRAATDRITGGRPRTARRA